MHLRVHAVQTREKKAAIVSQYNNFCDKWGFGDTHSKVGEGEYRRTDQVASVSNFGGLRIADRLRTFMGFVSILN